MTIDLMLQFKDLLDKANEAHIEHPALSLHFKQAIFVKIELEFNRGYLSADEKASLIAALDNIYPDGSI
ncbi:hypothetical protein AGMMS49573_10460 [Endomicrobiia bacterium]|nr:hypothetical protein AGMMS49573_10460 [Endomicrobiia bacterium]